MSNIIEPFWANYIAMDGDGLESYFENEPVLVNRRWRAKGNRLLVDGVFNNPLRHEESLRFTERAERKISEFISSMIGKENEEMFNQFYNEVIKPGVDAVLVEKNIKLEDITHVEVENIAAHYILYEHYQTRIAV